MAARELPDMSAIFSMVNDLRKSVASIGETQRKLAQVTAVAWSEDRFIKATVGPRGQLVDLEIDPRIYRNPNSAALAASIVATVRKAAEEAIAKTQEIVRAALPSDIPAGQRPDGTLSLIDLMKSHDGDLLKRMEAGQ